MRSNARVYGACLGFFVLSLLLTLLNTPDGQLLDRIFKYQSLLGGILAVFAAVVTVFAIIEAANIPVAEQRKNRDEERDAQRKVGAAILHSDLLHYCGLLLQESKKTYTEVSMVTAPASLASIDILASQDPAMVKRLAEFLRTASNFNWMCSVNPAKRDAEKDSDGVTEPKEKKVLHKMIEQAKGLRKDLGAIVNPADTQERVFEPEGETDEL